MKFSKFQSRLFVFTAMLMLALPFSVAAQDDDGYQVPLLEDGESVSDSFSGTATAKLYAFTASEGDVVTISMVQEEDSLDPYIVLLGPDGEVLAADDDSGEEAFSSLVEDFEIPADGSYYVLASSFGLINSLARDNAALSEDLPYSLTASGFSSPEDVEGDLSTLATVLEYGSSVQDTVTSDEPIQYYTFSAEAGDVIDMSMSSDDFDTLLQIFGVDGGRVYVNDDDDVSTNSAITGFEIPEDGVYLVFAADLYFNRAAEDFVDGGDFELSLTESAE